MFNRSRINSGVKLLGFLPRRRVDFKSGWSAKVGNEAEEKREEVEQSGPNVHLIILRVE
jgi:hypothetical protein